MNKMAFMFPLIAVVAWAANGTVSKMSVGVVTPETIAFYRWLLAALFLLPFVARSLWQQRRDIVKYFPKLAVLSALGMVIMQTLTYVAAQSTTGTNIALLGSVVPMMAMGWNILISRETPTQGMLAGSLVSFIGLSVLLTHGNPLTLFEQSLNRGDLLLVAGALCYGLYGVLLRKWNLPFSTWRSLFLQMSIAALWLAPVYFSQKNIIIASTAWPLILFAAFVASLLATYSWFMGIHSLGANRCSAYMNLTPLIGSGLAIWLLGERLSYSTCLGGGLTILGVFLTQKFNAKLSLRRKQML